MKTMTKLKVFFCAIMMAIGFACGFIPWGNPNAFHGVGFPFAQVYWEHGLDYPNPFAPFINALVFLILALVILLCIYLLKCVRKSVCKRQK